MLDKYNRNINYLRISLTDLCNYRCKYCMPEEGVKKKRMEEFLTYEELYYIVHLFAERGVNKVRLTGGEPLTRKHLEKFIYSISKLEKIKDIAMTTNASLLTDKAKILKESGLKRVNVSLDSLDEKSFKELTKGDLKDVLSGIDAALENGLGVKINTVLVKGVNDKEIGKFIQFAQDKKVDVRFIELMPIGPTADFSREHFFAIDEILDKYDLEKIEEENSSSPASLYKVKNSDARVGFIGALSHNFCSSCNRVRLTCDGKLITCLHSDTFIDLREPLRKGESINPYIDRAMQEKPERHHLLEGNGRKSSMNGIGG